MFPIVAENKGKGELEKNQRAIAVLKTKDTIEKHKKKSIHERLKINKELISKQQGKDHKMKGAEVGKNINL